MPLPPASPSAEALFAALGDPSASQTSNKRLQKTVQTLGWRNRHSQDDFYPIQVLNYDLEIQQHQRGEVEGTYGTGATVWPAAVVLIKYLEKQHAEGNCLVQNKTVIDLGSGTGCTSIASALLGVQHMVCTDGLESVVALARANVARTCQRTEGSTEADDATSFTLQGCRIDLQTYWWGRDSITSTDDCDVILVADCILPKLYPIAPLVQTLDTLLKSPTSMTLLSYEHRYYPDYDPAEKFRELCNARGLSVVVIPLSEQDPIYSTDDIFLWRVQRR